MTDRFFLQLKLSGLRAAVTALTVFFAGLAMVPLRAVIERVFDGSWPQTDWVMATKVIGTLAAGIFAVLLVTNFLDLRRTDTVDAEAQPAFRGTSFIRLVYAANVLLAGGLVWGLRRQHEPIGLQCVSLVFAVLAFFAWPRTIYFSNSGLSQRSRFGVLHVLRYKDVDYVAYDKSNNSTIVGGRDTTITHTSQHADPELFLTLLEERTGKTVTGLT